VWDAANVRQNVLFIEEILHYEIFHFAELEVEIGDVPP
jgi:hypothetical protein